MERYLNPAPPTVVRTYGFQVTLDRGPTRWAAASTWSGPADALTFWPLTGDTDNGAGAAEYPTRHAAVLALHRARRDFAAQAGSLAWTGRVLTFERPNTPDGQEQAAAACVLTARVAAYAAAQRALRASRGEWPTARTGRSSPASVARRLGRLALLAARNLAKHQAMTPAR